MSNTMCLIQYVRWGKTSRVLTLRGLVLSSAWGRRPAAPDGRSPASCLERGGYAAAPRTSAFPRFRGSSAPAGGFGGDGPLHPWARAHLGPGAHLGPHYRDSPLLPQGLLTPFGFGRGLPSWLALVVAPASASGPPTFPSRGGTSRILRGRRSSSTLWKLAVCLAPLGPGLGNS